MIKPTKQAKGRSSRVMGRPAGEKSIRHMAIFDLTTAWQRDFAEQLGISFAYLNQVLAGGRRASVWIALQIAAATGIPLLAMRPDLEGLPREIILQLGKVGEMLEDHRKSKRPEPPGSP